MVTSKKLFEQLVKESKSDPNILAFWLGGSRGKGMITKYSDYDCVMVVKAAVLSKYKKKYENLRDPNIELSVLSLDEFARYAKYGSDEAWDAYSYAYVTPLVAKTSEIKKLFREKATIPADKIQAHVGGALDAYINHLYRSLKCSRDKLTMASHLEAVQSIPRLLDAMFGLEGRLTPYPKYLEWELRKYPLKNLPWSKSVFLKLLRLVLERGDIPAQQKVLRGIEPVFRSKGYGHVIESCGDKLDWMKTFRKG